MSSIVLCHGSPEIVRKPEYDRGKPYDVYGRGFYCTENIGLSREWTCGENSDGDVNQYAIAPAGLEAA